MVEISQKFVAFSEYMNFNQMKIYYDWHFLAKFRFGGTLFSKIMPKFCMPNFMPIEKTAISVKPINCIDKLQQNLCPRVRNSTTHLTNEPPPVFFAEIDQESSLAPRKS